MTAPAWGLKLGAVALTAASLGASLQYVTTHVKNPLGPLQPPVADRSPEPVEAAEDLTPSPTPPTLVPTSVATRSPALPTGSAALSSRSAATVRPTFIVIPLPPTLAPRTPAPTLTLSPAVRATKLPAIANTHSS